MGSKEHDSMRCNDKMAEKMDYEGKFNTLRIISLKAISEFEDLQKKCEENYAKYLEEQENYLRTKRELDILKEVSGEALGEYENLHTKYTIELDCRDKAEEFAKQQVKENKQLKRQSAILLNTLAAKVVDIDLEELAVSQTANDNTSTADDHGVCKKQIEGLKEQVESLKIKTDDLAEKLCNAEEKLSHEIQQHSKTKEELENNNANFKQLNRVSLLALDDYSILQRRYEMEIQCREHAEKLAAEASREHEAMVKQSELISQDVAGEERLQKALEEISKLTMKLHDQRTEFDEKVKELEEELASSNDVHKLKSLEDKINTFVQGMETLETRLTAAQKRASDAETKAKNLEELLRKAQEVPEAPPPPPLPPPPPPPPAPAQLLRKFVGIVSSGKKCLKKSKPAVKEDPRIQAMSEMMERIKTGKVELKKTVQRQAASSNGVEGAAMDSLRDCLKTLKRSPSRENNEITKVGEQKVHTFGVQLRKAGQRKPRSASETDNPENDFRTVLRKPRSQSTGDMLEDEGDKGKTMDQDLLRLLQKQKAAAERDDTSTTQANKEARNEEQGDKTREDKGKTL